MTSLRVPTYVPIFVAALTLLLLTSTLTLSQGNDINALLDRADQLRNAGKYAEAMPLAQKSLELANAKFGPDHLSVAECANMVGRLKRLQGRYDEAEPLFKQALTIREKKLGPNHVLTSESLNNLGVLYFSIGRYEEAEPFYKRASAIKEKMLPAGDLEIAVGLNNLADLYRAQGRLADAEPLFKRSLVISEKIRSGENQVARATLNNLALLYSSRDRDDEARRLHTRALQVGEKLFGAEHPEVAKSLESLAGIFHRQRRFAEAEPLLKRAVAINEKMLGVGHFDMASSLISLGDLYRDQDRFAEAEPLLKRGLAIAENVLGPDHSITLGIVTRLGLLYRYQARYKDAEPLYKRVLAAGERTLGPRHPTVGANYINLAALYYHDRNYGAALDQARRGAQIIIDSETRELGVAETPDRPRSSRDGPLRSAWNLNWLVLPAWKVAEQHPAERAALAEETFAVAQRIAQNSAAAALAQMAVRQANGETALAKLVREQQDLASEWQTRDKQLIAALSLPPGRRDQQREAEQRTRLAAIDTRIAEIDKTLARQFPDYAALAKGEALSVAATQSLLAADEVLLVFLGGEQSKPAPFETFLWAISKTDSRWVKIDGGIDRITRQVQELRCGLDQAAWQSEGTSKCANLVGKTNTSASGGGALPFNVVRAHELYRALFGQVGDLIRGKRLLIVPSGPLTVLPFQVLVTEQPAGDGTDYANAAWLVKSHATTVLPSVSSLKALRQLAKASKATKPFIGFGNPLLVGPSGNDRSAWERQNCKTTIKTLQVVSRSIRATTPAFFRNGLANVDLVRSQYPLPETADELCSVAASMGASEGEVYLGAKASEKQVKSLSANGALARARVVHFATHGLLAGETEALAPSKAEPALLLTPPQQATAEDDGLLAASEVAQLKLDADWVVLSACNTASASADKPGADALSGLARAFFYAGARALLVSHWAVNSEATVRLITKAFDELKADPRTGRAEAMRRSMLALIESGGGYAHPANWSPFVVVGEGAR